ncbi:MAG: hypothetical protein SFU87_01540 [Chitinophagaceae bacterium]|nr:hypothetical protein [Chitinophagaceae bacterium]
MKKFLRRALYVMLAVVVVWIILTIWAKAEGGTKQWSYGNNSAPQKILIVYDPDPFYNLDEQVCKAFGEPLAIKGVQVTVATVAAATKMESRRFNGYVFCANTYNWQPDWAVSRFIKNHQGLKDKPAIAITLGAGSTAASQKALEKLILKKEAHLAVSCSFWLLKPNDESKMNESNVKVATVMAKEWAVKMIPYLKHK